MREKSQGSRATESPFQTALVDGILGGRCRLRGGEGDEKEQIEAEEASSVLPSL